MCKAELGRGTLFFNCQVQLCQPNPTPHFLPIREVHGKAFEQQFGQQWKVQLEPWWGLVGCWLAWKKGYMIEESKRSVSAQMIAQPVAVIRIRAMNPH